MYKVDLEVFEGPFDLLLYLIKKSEVDIRDIPIAKITQEYLDVLEKMREMDFNVAGEFLVMAAQLLLIKSRMLLPVDATGAEGEALEEDPRAELVRQLLEYRRFKEAAFNLQEMETRQRDVFTRFFPDTGLEKEPVSPDEVPLEVNLYDLLKAFEKVLAELPAETVREMEREEVHVAQKMNEILDLLEARESVSFFEAFASSTTKVAIVATFLAMLELARIKSVKIRQAQRFGEIRLYRSSAEAQDAPAAAEPQAAGEGGEPAAAEEAPAPESGEPGGESEKKPAE